jgi:hypothetical protein
VVHDKPVGSKVAVVFARRVLDGELSMKTFLFGKGDQDLCGDFVNLEGTAQICPIGKAESFACSLKFLRNNHDPT